MKKMYKTPQTDATPIEGTSAILSGSMSKRLGEAELIDYGKLN